MASASKSSAPLQARKQQFVSNEIWGVAIDLLFEKGYGATTVEEMAEAAGVSRRTFFRYFPSKDHLMLQGVETYKALLTDAIRACPAGQAPLAVVREAVLTVAEHVTAQPRSRKVMHIAQQSAAARGALLSRFAELEEHLTFELAARLKRRTKNDLLPRVLASLALSTLNLTFQIWFEQSKEDVSATIERVFATYSSTICDQS